MLRITQPAVAAAGTAEHPLATIGRQWVRYALVVVIAWIGTLRMWYTQLSRGLWVTSGWMEVAS